jgi:hypothetical protein
MPTHPIVTIAFSEPRLLNGIRIDQLSNFFSQLSKKLDQMVIDHHKIFDITPTDGQGMYIPDQMCELSKSVKVIASNMGEKDCIKESNLMYRNFNHFINFS